MLGYILLTFIPAALVYYYLLKELKWPLWSKLTVAPAICVLFVCTLFLYLTQKREGFIFVKIRPPQEATIFIDSAERRKIDFADVFLVNAGKHIVIAKLNTSEQEETEVEVDPNDNIRVEFVFEEY